MVRSAGAALSCGNVAVGTRHLGCSEPSATILEATCRVPYQMWTFFWQAYRAAALRYHPDKHKGDVEGAKKKFQAAKDARDLLTDAKARAALDALLGCVLSFLGFAAAKKLTCATAAQRLSLRPERAARVRLLPVLIAQV